MRAATEVNLIQNSILMTVENKVSHLAAVAHHGLEAVLRVQVPPLHKTVLGAAEHRQSCVTNTALS